VSYNVQAAAHSDRGVGERTEGTWRRLTKGVTERPPTPRSVGLEFQQ